MLRQRKLGEADKIVTLYTSHEGKLDAVAKGVRRTKSRLAGHLEPLTLGAYLLAEGRELDIVTQAETVDAFPALRDDLERLSRGLYCAELVERLTPERSEGNPIFRLLAETLGYLDSAPEYELVVRRFELRLLGELGYRPSLAECAVCGKRLEPETNFWSADAGGAVCPALRRRLAAAGAAQPQRPEAAAAAAAGAVRGGGAGAGLGSAGARSWRAAWATTCATCWSARCAARASSRRCARIRRGFEGRGPLRPKPPEGVAGVERESDDANGVLIFDLDGTLVDTWGRWRTCSARCCSGVVWRNRSAGPFTRRGGQRAAAAVRRGA